MKPNIGAPQGNSYGIFNSWTLKNWIGFQSTVECVPFHNSNYCRTIGRHSLGLYDYFVKSTGQGNRTFVETLMVQPVCLHTTC